MAGPAHAPPATEQRIPDQPDRTQSEYLTPFTTHATGNPSKDARSQTRIGIVLAVSARMKCVYLIRSLSAPGQRYIGVTSNLEERLRAHNAGHSPHTSKYTPWALVTCIRFVDDPRAIEFERYLKSGSGQYCLQAAAALFVPARLATRRQAN